jgi:stage II sporulation protein AA (anti-sigma F factor antagonist)
MEVLESSLCDVPVLKPTGEVDHSNAPVLEESVQKALRANGGRLLLDLTDCPYLDSGGLSVLLSTVREVCGRGWLGVIAPTPNVLRLFQIVGLVAAPDFRVFSDSDQAMVALAG